MNYWVDIFSAKFAQWWQKIVHLLPNLVLAMIIMAVSILAGRLVRRTSYKLLNRLAAKELVSSLFSTLAQIALLFVGLFIALDILQLNRAVSSLLAGAGIIGIILGFAFQDITANFIAGIYIAFKKPFDIGHTVKTNDFIGHVEQIQIRSTTIRTFSGLHLMIPNRDIIQKPLINYSLTSERRIELEFFIDSAADLKTVHKTVADAMNNIDYLYPGKAIEIYFNDFKENAVKLVVWYWINNHTPPGYMVARHDAILHIMTALQEQSISLQVPITLQQFKSVN